MGYSRKVDDNQPEIVAALRQVGASILDLSQVGKGCPDLLVSFRETIYLIEIKSKIGKLNALQKKWHAEWQGRKPEVVRSVDEALVVIGAK